MEYLEKVFLRSQSRGRDASGVANQGLGYLKSTEDAGKLVKSSSFKRFMKRSIGRKWVIGHTRAATQGDPQDNYNNHPITTKKGKFLMIHNGIVGSVKIDEDTNITDSYVVAKAIKRAWTKDSLFKSVQDAYKYFYGWAGIVVISTKEIVLARRLAPIAIGEFNGSIVFASERGFISEAKNVMMMNDNRVIGYDSDGHIQRGRLRHIDRPLARRTYYPEWEDEGGREVESVNEMFRYRWKDYGPEYISVGKKGRKTKKIRKKSWEVKPKKGKGWFRESAKHRIARLNGLRKQKEKWRKKRKR